MVRGDYERNDLHQLNRTTTANSNLVAPAPLTPVDPKAQQAPIVGTITAVERRRAFKQIIVKCVLQLLLIETTHELLQNDDVYNTIPAEHLLRFMTVLDDSYQFARRFNADKDLRMALWKVGALSRERLFGCLVSLISVPQAS